MAASAGQLPQGVGIEEPRMPSDYALNVLASRFVTLTGVRIKATVGGVDEPDPSLVQSLGPDVDATMEGLLDSLAHVAKRNAKAVIDSLVRWRSAVLADQVDVADVRGAMAGTQLGLTASSSVRDVAAVLTRRKQLASAYLLARALGKVASQLTPGAMPERHWTEVQATAFDLMRECGRERLPSSRMQAEAFDAASMLLGVLSKASFVAVGDRFIAFLEQQQQQRNQVSSSSSKETEIATEMAIVGMRHLPITPYPMELFEEGAEFLETVSRNYAAAHGQRLKYAYAETLTNLLLPVAQSASAELHHPTWTKALETIAPRAMGMVAKPRYWAVAYPLYVAVLCVSPEDRFLHAPSSSSSSSSSGAQWSWSACIEAGIPKLKDRASRSIVLNAAVCLLWSYLFRCRESSTSTTKRLESFFRTWFPPHRSNIVPTETVVLTPHIVMLHLVLYRQFDFGCGLVLDLLRHSALGGKTLSLQPEALSRQRMTIAIRAVLLTLDAYVRAESPPMPTPARTFSSISSISGYDAERPGLGDQLPEAFAFPRPEIGDAQANFNDLIGKIALICDHEIGGVVVFDEQASGGGVASAAAAAAAAITTSSSTGANDEDRLTWRVHVTSRLRVGYNREHQASMDLLRVCFESWPRCLSSSIPFSSVLATLYRGHFSADPVLADAASQSLRRIASLPRGSSSPGGASTIVTGFMRYIFRPDTIFWETHRAQTTILPKVELAVKLWVELLNIWLAQLRGSVEGSTQQRAWEMERTSAWAIIDEVEAHGFFLLCSAWRPLRRHAISVLRLVAVLDEVFQNSSNNRMASFGDGIDEEEDEEPTRVIHLLDMPCSRFVAENDDDDKEQADGLSAFKAAASASKWIRGKETLCDVAESDNSSEHALWLKVLPRFLRQCLDHFPTTVAVFRTSVTNRVLSMDHAVGIAAGTMSSSTTTTTGTNSSASGQGVAGGTSNGAHVASSSGAGSFQSSIGGPTLAPDQTLMADHWRMYILSLCTTTTSTEGSRNRGGPDAMGERSLAARDLFQRLVPFLASDHAKFRDSVVTALGNINKNLYKTLLETMQSVSSQLNEDFKSKSLSRTQTAGTIAGMTVAPQRKTKRHQRLRTSVAHVIHLTTANMVAAGQHSVQEYDKERDAIVSLILHWIRDTLNFLTDADMRSDWELQRLRRFFSKVVEDLFGACGSSVQMMLGIDTRLRMFSLFGEWHSYSQAAKDGPTKLSDLLASVAEQHRDDKQQNNILWSLRNETHFVSLHAAGAMAALCQGAIPVANSSEPPTSTHALPPVEPASLLSWLHHLFESSNRQNNAIARRALRSLLDCNVGHRALVGQTIDMAFSESEKRPILKSVFGILVDYFVAQGTSGEGTATDQSTPLEQIICLGLIKLGHPEAEVRRRAFVLLRTYAPVTCPIHAIEGGVGSPLPATYLRAQRDISSILAFAFASLKVAVLSEYTLRLPLIDSARRATTLGLLPEWLQQIDLVPAEYANEEWKLSVEATTSGSPLPYQTTTALANLMALTIRYGDEHNFEIQDMWASLAEGGASFERNARVVVRFLVSEALYLRSPTFVTHAKRAVSCLSHTVLAPLLFDELCAYIDPTNMILQPLDNDPCHVLPVPGRDRRLYVAHLESLISSSSHGQFRQTFSPGQLALLYVAELTYEKSDRLSSKIALLLHAIFMHVDSVSIFSQEQAMAMLEQLVRTSAAGVEANQDVENLFDKGRAIFWTDSDLDIDVDHARTPRMMRSTLLEVVSILQRCSPLLSENLAQRWGARALHWATVCPIRHLACRSFQAFRILLPDRVSASMLADMLKRLSNTISDASRTDDQAFALETLVTLTAVARSPVALLAYEEDVISPSFAHLFWCNVASLSTINEREFSEAIAMLEALLDKVDVGNKSVVDALRRHCPDGWEGEPGGIQTAVLRGLRSSLTSSASFALLARLAKVQDATLLDDGPSDSRLGFLFVASLPWFLELADEPHGPHADMVRDLAHDIAALAGTSNKTDLQRVATSIALARFRTRDDLVRQAMSSVKAHFMPHLGPLLAVLLIGLTLNSLEWVRRQTLKVLNVFLPAMDPRSKAALAEMGAEVIMPLLRLLSVPGLSSQALEVLDEQLELRDGPGANQMLRLSLLGMPSADGKMMMMPVGSTLFGTPDENGWGVANAQESTSRTRINILAVFKECEMGLGQDCVPVVGEVNFRVSEETAGEAATVADGEPASAGGVDTLDNLGDLVSQLHDLESFFVDEQQGGSGSGGGGGSGEGLSSSMSMSTMARSNVLAMVRRQQEVDTYGHSARPSQEGDHEEEDEEDDDDDDDEEGEHTARRNIAADDDEHDGHDVLYWGRA
ncbi:hypothetical protein FA10DRAFT_226487 [Acaromyces ingoldii]|uniref:Uncharacterized protein n=1 Tax=Acaromyces ingoldii TaxID=215250 RepID=A0A316YXX1_9BASI|nr:hypothetical protein FA10DRAFT_226487 [Acaromyces ingoldii]PWN94109.1 hypothetical protein FA10DRAFT_226487 [Acaromyces ingoldii]